METLGQKNERGREWIITGNRRQEIPDAKDEEGEATDNTASGGERRERNEMQGMAAVRKWIKLAGDREIEENAEGSRSDGGQIGTGDDESKTRQ